MIALVFLLMSIVLLTTTVVCIHQILMKGDTFFGIVFIILFLPFYTTYQSLLFQVFGSEALIVIFRYIKELVFLIVLFSMFFYNKEMGLFPRRMHQMDYLMIFFLGLSVLFCLLPLGSESFFSKATYLKNILLIGFAYVLGRHVTLSDRRVLDITRMILFLIFLSLLSMAGESFANSHFHSFIGYGNYNHLVNEIEPTGNYGLSWTFESGSGQKRFAGFMSNPLEMASYSLLAIVISFILMLKSKFRSNAWIYGLFVLIGIICLSLTFSRAAMLSLALMFLVASLILRYYSFLITIFSALAIISVSVFLFAEEETLFFIQDTLMLQDSSSVGHVVEWLVALDSMIQNPLGIGLGMSGNAGGVDTIDKVGGENQFLIFGVQMGVIGLLSYLAITFGAIYWSFKSFRIENNSTQSIIIFVGCVFKVGFLLPLMTANAEIYLPVSLLSWLFIGLAIQRYMINQKLRKVSHQEI